MAVPVETAVHQKPGVCCLSETWVENDAEEVGHGAETQRWDQAGTVQTDDDTV